MWFAGLREIVRRFHSVVFKQTDPISGDALPVVYTYLITQPCIRQYAYFCIDSCV